MPARIRLGRLAVIVGVWALAVFVAPQEWRLGVVFAGYVVVWFLSRRFVENARGCPVCHGSGLAWGSKHGSRLVCARCGGFGIVDRVTGRRVYARNGNMRGDL